MMESEFGLPGVMQFSSSVWIPDSTGAESSEYHSLSYKAAPDFLPIEEFTKLHVIKLEGLFIAIAAKLIELKFAIVPIASG
jgi:hypothetical protein